MDRIARLVLCLQLGVWLSGCFLFPTKDCDNASCRAADAGGGDLPGGDLSLPSDLSPLPPDLRPECMVEGDCAAGQTCTGGRCGPCSLHSECNSQACEVYQPTPRGMGRCLAQAEVIYVDNKNGGGCAGVHAGTLGDPVCGVDQGVMLLSATRATLRVLPSSAAYPVSPLTGKKLTILGAAGQGGKTSLGDVAALAALDVLAGTEVTVDGAELSAANGYGVRCNSDGTPSVTLHRLRISAPGAAMSTGVFVQNCKLNMDRTLVDNNGVALVIDGTQDFSITNSFLINNTTTGADPPLRLLNTAAAVRVFRFNTVANNKAGTAVGFRCDGLQIEDSIIVQNTMQANSQLAGTCTLSASTVIGMGDAAAGGIKQSPEFVRRVDGTTGVEIDFALNPDGTVNKMYLLDKAAGVAATDFFGIRRPGGTAADIGAHEAN